MLSDIWRPLFRLARFGLVGGIAALVYALVFLAMVKFLATGSIVSSTVAYGIAIPVSFVGQKYFTFKSQGAARREFAGYLLLQAANLVVSVALTYAVIDVLGLGYYVSISGVVFFVALSSYISMRFAIFSNS